MSKTFDTRVMGICVTLVLSLCASALGQVNSWTNPASAAWEQMYWSLGVLPDSSQSVMITNAGYKAVGISPSTRANYPSSMTVSNLTVSAPTNAFNTLLLNFFGTGTPLEVLNGCAIETNGVIENLYSALEVHSAFEIDYGGQYVEEGGVTIATNAIEVIGGSVDLTNATVQGYIELYGGTITQVQGQTSGDINIGLGSYNMLSGTFTGQCAFGDSAEGAEFNQYGGTNVGNIITEDGYGQYAIYDGLANESDINLGYGDYGNGEFAQYGGTVITPTIELGGYGDGANNGNGGYTLTNGTLRVGEILFQSGGFGQSGGQLISSNAITLRGVPDFDYGPALYVGCSISGGELFSPEIFVSLNGSFYQSGGTNIVSGDLSVGGSSYSFSGGLLVAATVNIFPAEWGLPGYPEYEGSFQQTGGELYVSNGLGISDFYSISGGSIYTTNINDGGLLTVSSNASILNPGVFQFGGALNVSGGTVENLGQMLLYTNSFIEFFTGSNRISFSNSAAMNWTPGSSLTVLNWNGSTTGGGTNQLLFGNGSSGLTSAQLRQIVFANPAGFPAGNYAANILPNGEVVPLPNPILSWQNIQGQLVISWGGQPTLQTSTNASGPYMDVSNATSPYTNISSQSPIRFFRLKR